MIQLGTTFTGFKNDRRSTNLCWCDGELLCMLCPFHFLYDPQESLGDWEDEWGCPVCTFFGQESQ